MGITLQTRKNSKGILTPFLRAWHNGKMTYEFLTHLKFSDKSDPVSRMAKKENLALAERMRLDRAQQIASGEYGLKIDSSNKAHVLTWMQSYLDNYPKTDKRNMVAVKGRFERWLTKRRKGGLVMKEFTKGIAVEFKAELETTCEGEGARSYWSRFAKMVTAAVSQELLSKNPCAGVKAPDGRAATRDTLDSGEIERLANTPTEAKKSAQGRTIHAQHRYCLGRRESPYLG